MVELMNTGDAGVYRTAESLQDLLAYYKTGKAVLMGSKTTSLGQFPYQLSYISADYDYGFRASAVRVSFTSDGTKLVVSCLDFNNKNHLWYLTAKYITFDSD